MKAIKVIVITLIVAVGIGGAITVFGHGMRGPAKSRFGFMGRGMIDAKMIVARFKEPLNLTDEQEAKILPIVEANMEKWRAMFEKSRGQARQAVHHLLGLKQPPTAVFTASDSMALEVMGVINEEGKNIPTDLSIIGFDDNPSGLYGQVALTTIKQPLIKMAEEAVKRLNLLISGKDKTVKKLILPTELVVRESCRSLK